MNAREKWHKESMRLAGEFAKTVGNACFGLFVDESKPALNRLEAHLRTTPEGFALVPVPEWVPFDEFTSYPAPGSSGWFWYIKDDEIFRGTAMQVCLARGVTYWCPADNPPAPPKAPPPKSEPL